MIVDGVGARGALRTLLLMLVVAVSAQVAQIAPAAQVAPAVRVASATPVTAVAAEPTPVQVLRRQVARAAEATRAPSLRGAVQIDTWQEVAAENARRGVCTSVPHDDPDACLTGLDGSPRIAMLGDSTAIAYVVGVRRAAVTEGWQLQELTQSGCATWKAAPGDEPVLSEGCEDHLDWVRDRLREDPAEVAVLTSTPWLLAGLSQRSGGISAQDAVVVMREATDRFVRSIKPYAGRIVLLPPPPQTPFLRACLNAGVTACIGRLDAIDQAVMRALASVAEQRRVRLVRTDRWFCTRDGVCPSWAGRTRVLADGLHMSVEFSRRLAPLLRQALLRRPEGAG